MNVVIDCATGGNESENHSLLALSCIKTTATYEIVDELHLRIRHPTFVVTMEALAKNHIDLCDPTGTVDINSAKTALFKFLGTNPDAIPAMLTGKAPASRASKARHKIVGINISYDIPFLKKFLGEPVYDCLFHWRPLDVLSTFEFLYSLGVVSEPTTTGIAGLAEAFGLSVSEDKVHEPQYASVLTARIARRVNKKGLQLTRLVSAYGSTVPGLLGDADTARRLKATSKARDDLDI